MGTHPIFESDFDCLTVIYLEWTTNTALKWPMKVINDHSESELPI